jgi:catechol 2,3-dioxygenase-like lactoylglutathione lyase family enzyme
MTADVPKALDLPYFSGLVSVAHRRIVMEDEELPRARMRRRPCWMNAVPSGSASSRPDSFARGPFAKLGAPQRRMQRMNIKETSMTVKRMDNVGIVVDDIDAAIEFFMELGLELEGRAPVEGDWADGVTALRGMRVEIAMMRTPDGHSRLELSRFLAPPVVADHRSAPVNALGYLRVMFTVEDIDDTLARLGGRGAKLVGEVVQYQNMYRLCYIRGPEGILIGLAQQLGQQNSRENPMGHER